jgi:hypothetical protein
MAAVFTRIFLSAIRDKPDIAVFDAGSSQAVFR